MSGGDWGDIALGAVSSAVLDKIRAAHHRPREAYPDGRTTPEQKKSLRKSLRDWLSRRTPAEKRAEFEAWTRDEVLEISRLVGQLLGDVEDLQRAVLLLSAQRHRVDSQAGPREQTPPSASPEGDAA